jgi:hypothetical protein
MDLHEVAALSSDLCGRSGATASVKARHGLSAIAFAAQSKSRADQSGMRGS